MVESMAEGKVAHSRENANTTDSCSLAASCTNAHTHTPTTPTAAARRILKRAVLDVPFRQATREKSATRSPAIGRFTRTAPGVGVELLPPHVKFSRSSKIASEN